jgi:hypothetical protein
MASRGFIKHSENQQKINAFGYRCIELLHHSIKKQSNPIEIDLIELFFHELVCFYSSAYIVILTQHKSEEKASLPYVNNTFIKDPTAYSIQDLNVESTPFYYWIFKLNFWAKKTLWIGSSLRREEKEQLFKNAWKVKIKQAKSNEFPVNADDYQLFLSKVKQTSRILDLPFTEKHFHALDNYFREYICFEQYEKSLKANHFLLAGTNVNLKQRLASANCIKNSGKVISFGHGHASIGVFDEPIFKYGELCFSSSYVDFGKLPVKKQSNDRLVLKRASSHIQKIRNKKYLASTKKLLYIPTSLSSYKTYAPYRNFYDAFYIDWQKVLVETLTKNNVDYRVKIHPKSIESYSYLQEENLEKDTLEKCFDRYDGFIFDYVSTALTETLATNKKIIVFDLGNRKIVPEALECIKQDTLYTKIAFDQPLEEQIEAVLSLEKKRQFGYTNTYSLGGQSITEIIKDIVR